MSILKEISPIKNSMTFQLERETQCRQSTSKDALENLEKAKTEKTEGKYFSIQKRGSVIQWIEEEHIQEGEEIISNETEIPNSTIYILNL